MGLDTVEKREKKMVEINSENYPEYIIEGDKEIKNMRGYQIQGINWENLSYIFFNL